MKVVHFLVLLALWLKFFNILVDLFTAYACYYHGLCSESIRLAAAKSVLRLSRRWDLHISPEVFSSTISVVKVSMFSCAWIDQQAKMAVNTSLKLQFYWLVLSSDEHFKTSIKFISDWHMDLWIYSLYGEHFTTTKCFQI